MAGSCTSRLAERASSMHIAFTALYRRWQPTAIPKTGASQ
jgi:hypothetical protein